MWGELILCLSLLSCYNKIPRTEGLINNIDFFVLFLEAEGMTVPGWLGDSLLLGHRLLIVSTRGQRA